jgi:hypothetical protein
MSSPRLSVRISPPLLERLESYIDCQGLTVGVLAAHRVADLCEIASYVGDNERLPLAERMSRVEKRLAQLEGKVRWQ